MMAAELGASVKTARRAALLHDIGKAVTTRWRARTPSIGAEIASKLRRVRRASSTRSRRTTTTCEPQTVEAVLVQAADAISGARPARGARSLENYIKRLETLEKIADRLRRASRSALPSRQAARCASW